MVYNDTACLTVSRVTADRHMYDDNNWTLHCSNWLTCKCLSIRM